MESLNDIKSPHELLEFMEKHLKYGFTADGETYTFPRTDDAFLKKYKIRLGDDLVNSGYGVCWDFLELARSVFEKLGIQHECYFLHGQYKENPNQTSTHTFLTFKEDKKWKLFKPLVGIYEFDTKTQAIKDEVIKHLEAKKCITDRFDLFKYPKVTENMNVIEFVDHCHKGEQVKYSNKNKEDDGLLQ